VAVIVAIFAAPATAAVASPPAVDQYTQHLPGAGGGSGLASGSAPVARPWLLSAKTRAALPGPDGQLLVQIATAPGLGAPQVKKGGANGPGPGSSALPSALVDTAGTGPILGMVGALVAIAAVAVGAQVVRRRRSASL
jgi:hypothetical protein